MENTYMVYLKATGEAFMNPAPSMHGNPDPAFGAESFGCIVLARGNRAQAEAIVSAINAALSPVTVGNLL
jgi:hypothetical protein